jgi:hypothetical protein
MKETAALAQESKEDDPFLITTRTIIGRKIIPDLYHFPPPLLFLPLNFDDTLLPSGLRNRDNITQQRRALLLRSESASFGGVALVGPMLLMELHKGFVTSLVRGSVVVMVDCQLTASIFSQSVARAE